MGLPTFVDESKFVFSAVIAVFTNSLALRECFNSSFNVSLAKEPKISSSSKGGGDDGRGGGPLWPSTSNSIKGSFNTQVALLTDFSALTFPFARIRVLSGLGGTSGRFLRFSLSIRGEALDIAGESSLLETDSPTSLERMSAGEAFSLSFNEYTSL